MKILEREISPPKRNYLKIETSGLSKELDSIISIAIYEKDSKIAKIFYVENFKDEEKLLKEAVPFIEGKKFVTYSGKSFDLPFFKTKYDFYFSKKVDLELIDLQEISRKYNFIYKLPSHSNKNLLKEFVKESDNNKKEYQGIKIKSLFKNYIEGDKNAMGKIIEYSFNSIDNLVKLDESIRKDLKNKIKIDILNSEFFMEDFKILENIIEISGKTSYSKDYFATNSIYTLEILNQTNEESFINLEKYTKTFTLKINTDDGLYDENNKCFYLLKKELPFEINNKSEIKSPSKILILYYKDHIFENQKELCKKILELELSRQNIDKL